MSVSSVSDVSDVGRNKSNRGQSFFARVRISSQLSSRISCLYLKNTRKISHLESLEIWIRNRSGALYNFWSLEGRRKPSRELEKIKWTEKASLRRKKHPTGNKTEKSKLDRPCPTKKLSAEGRHRGKNATGN